MVNIEPNNRLGTADKITIPEEQKRISYFDTHADFKEISFKIFKFKNFQKLIIKGIKNKYPKLTALYKNKKA